MREGRADGPRERRSSAKEQGARRRTGGEVAAGPGVGSPRRVPGDVRVAEPANNDAEQSRRHGGSNTESAAVQRAKR